MASASRLIRRRFLLGLAVCAWARASDRPRLPLLLGDQLDRAFVLPLLRLVAEGGGFEWDFRFVSWPRLLAESAQGGALAWGVSRNSERDKLYNYSESVFTNHVWLIAPADQPLAAPDVAQLQGRTLCLRRGFSLGPALDAARGTLFKAAETDLGYEALLRMMRAGRCDGLLMTHRSGDPAIVEQRVAVLAPTGRFVVQRPPLHEAGIYFVAAKGRPDLTTQLQQVNLGLRARARAIQARVSGGE